ncbi:MAG: oligosaccharide flippase family protein [Rhodocyclaceae bacterium]|nr:oligosaccharide flippase family protein [Rhodocyclaceae bacterium]
MAIQFVASNGAMAVNFVLVIILSRMLSPAEIGIFSLSAVVVGFAHVFRDFGVSAFIKQQKELTTETLRAAMGLLICASWSIAILLFLVSGTVAEYFGQDGVRPTLQVLAAGFLLIPFGAIPQAVLGRDLQVGKQAIVTATSTITYFCASIAFANAGFSYMTMAWANLINITVTGLAYIAVRPKGMPWLPSLTGWRKVINFGTGAMLTSSLQAIDDAIGDLMLGKLSGPHLVGLFSRANSTVNILSHIARPTIEYTALPYLSRVHHSGADLSIEVRRAVTYLTGIYWPALLAIGFFATDIVALLYGSNWLEASAAIPWLCIAIGTQITFSLLRPALTGMGHPYLIAVPLAWCVLFKVALVLTLFNGSLASFAESFAWAEILTIPIYLVIAHRFMNISPSIWYLAIQRSLVVAFFIGIGIAGLLTVLAPITTPALRLLAVIPSLCMLWLMLLHWTRHPLIGELHRALKWLKDCGFTEPVRHRQKLTGTTNDVQTAHLTRRAIPVITANTMPSVSVVIPVRNGRNYIHAALESICEQNFGDLEIIVVDDGSDDFDYATLVDFDPRVRILKLHENGVSAARNAGMRISNGNYIAFLDADDIWFPGKLAAQIRYFEHHPEIGCVFGGFTKWYVNEDGEFPDAKDLMEDCSELVDCEPERSGWLYTRLLTGLLVGMNTAVIRREVFELLGGFDESMRIGEDYLFWLKVSRVFEMHALNGKVALYRIHPSSAMSHLDLENHQARLLEIAAARWGLKNPDGSELPREDFSKRIAESEFTHAHRHFWHGSTAVARRSFFKAMIGGTRPLRSAAYIALSPFRRWLYSYAN